MRLAVDRLQLSRVEVCVALGGIEPRMAQQFLNAAQIGAPLQQVRGEGMPQRVRTHPHPRAHTRHIHAQQAIDAASRQSPAALIDEQRLGQPPPPARLARAGVAHR